MLQKSMMQVEIVAILALVFLNKAELQCDCKASSVCKDTHFVSILAFAPRTSKKKP